jgi:hypothetical protein
MRMVTVVALLMNLAHTAWAWEAQDVLDPTPDDIVGILDNLSVESVEVLSGCAEFGTDQAKPGCYQAEKKILGKLAGATFSISLVRCAKPDVDCEGLLFEMWRRSSKRNANLLDDVNDWNRSKWMVKIFGEPGWLRVMMHVPVKGGIPQATLEGYVRIWIAAGKEAAARFSGS